MAPRPRRPSTLARGTRIPRWIGFPIAHPVDRNEHQLIPFNVTIEAGGTVNFIISGLHQVIVYDDGTRPDDIDTTLTTTTGAMPSPAVVLIDDPTHRIYRGLDPSLFP